MDVQDLTHNRKIARLTVLTRDLEDSRTPEETMLALQRGFAEPDGLSAMVLLSTRGLGPGQYRVVRMQLADAPANHVVAPARAEQAPVRSGGILGAIVGRPEPQLIQNVDWSDDPHFGQTLQGCASVIAIPVPGDRLPMNWAILLKNASQRFAVSDVEEAVERVALAGALLANQWLAAELAAAHRRIDRDARQVGELQRALLPASLPHVAGLEIATSYEPSGRAGGDLYDFFPLDDARDVRADTGVAPERWCVFIGDASGHGLAAAVVMAIVQAVLHARPPGIHGPAALLMYANRHLCDKGLGGFFTAFLGAYQPVSRRFTYANAGHPAPLVKRSSGGPMQLLDAAASFPLGIVDDTTYDEAVVQLERDDLVLLYTDGITEARHGQGELFEQNRLIRIMRETSGGPAALIERLRAAVREHQHGQPAIDDQTLVAARVL